MADELSLRVIARLSTDVTPRGFDESVTDDQATAIVEAGGQTVGTSHEVLDLGDVAAPSTCILRNSDAANYVEIGREIAAAFEPFARIRPGQIAILQPASGVTLYAKADTAPVTLNRFIPST